MTNIERRTMIEARIEAADARHLRGYPIVFHVRSLDLGGFVEIIHPEAVDQTLRDSVDVRALINHEAGKVIARTRAGTLALSKDGHGLRATMETDPEISYVGDIMRSVQRGDVTGMSFGFRVPPGGDSWDWDGPVGVRTVHDLRLAEVSIVSFPAYPQTDVQVAQRAFEEFRAETWRPSLAFLERLHKQRLAG